VALPIELLCDNTNKHFSLTLHCHSVVVMYKLLMHPTRTHSANKLTAIGS